MKRKSVAQIVIDLAHSNDLRHQKSFSFSGSPEEVFTVTVTRKTREMLIASFRWRLMQIQFQRFLLALVAAVAMDRDDPTKLLR